MDKTYIKSPLNYNGGKHKILNQLLPLFPKHMNTFVDLFAGGCNVGINVEAKQVFFNDCILQLIKLYKELQERTLEYIVSFIEKRIFDYDLNTTNAEGYIRFRDNYNEGDADIIDLFVLICYAFNNQIRFNQKGQFNMPFGKDRSSFNSSIHNNLIMFINKLQSIEAVFTNLSFIDFPFDMLNKNDFVYCDPPYLITTAGYNEGKTGWKEKNEIDLLKLLDNLNTCGIKFGLSNVLEHKGKVNNILKQWLELNKEYKIHYISRDYSNYNYHTKIRDKSATTEVLITNY